MEKIVRRALLSATALAICTSCLYSAQVLAQGTPVIAPPYNSYFSPYNTGYNGWHGYVGYNYQQFSNNGTAFAESSTGKIYNIDPSYQSGYNLGLGYLFPGRGTDIKLDYTYLHTSNSNSAWASSLTLSPTDLGPVTWATSKLTFNYDTVNLTAGHMINFTPYFTANFYGGFNYIHLAKDMTITGMGFGNDIYVNVGTSFTGYGLTFGMDGYCRPFDLYPNFSLVGGVNPTFAYGTMTGYVRTNVNDFRASDNIPNEKLVVPGLGGKFGVNYDYLYRNTKLNFQLGYQATEYFGITRDATYHNQTNASLQGLYFNVGAGF